jgi:hypothetical protein
METAWVYYFLFLNKTIQHIWVYDLQWQFPNAGSRYHLFHGGWNLHHRIACCKHGTLTAVLVTSGTRKVGSQNETVGTGMQFILVIRNHEIHLWALHFYTDMGTAEDLFATGNCWIMLNHWWLQEKLLVIWNTLSCAK